MKPTTIRRPILAVLALGAQMGQAAAVEPMDGSYAVTSSANSGSGLNNYDLQTPDGPKITISYDRDRTNVEVIFSTERWSSCDFDGSSSASKHATRMMRDPDTGWSVMSDTETVDIPKTLLQAVVSGMDQFTMKGTRELGHDDDPSYLPNPLSRDIDRLMKQTYQCDVPLLSLRTPLNHYASVTVTLRNLGLA